MSTRDFTQLDLFTGAPSETPRGRKEAPPGPAVLPEEVQALGARLPAGLYLGTSSWSFSGWTGLVYDRDASASKLANEGLAAYARHPVLRAVGVDRTFYAPVPASVFAEYAAQVPPGFRFLVKAHEDCTLARFPAHARYGAWRGKVNDRFFDPAYARDLVVGPLVEGLGTRAGPLVFQLPPQDVQALGGPERFAERVHAFFSALPRGVLYALEVRNAELMTSVLAQALADSGACPVLAGWGNLPTVAEQAEQMRVLQAPMLVVRWMLRPGLGYEEARERYSPFNRLVDEDPSTRSAVARACVAAIRAGKPAMVILNNKAEGSAPLSALALARAIDRVWQEE
jgi:uncharacterized protein YecE (DUF72 family)